MKRIDFINNDYMLYRRIKESFFEFEEFEKHVKGSAGKNATPAMINVLRNIHLENRRNELNQRTIDLIEDIIYQEDHGRST